MVESVHSKNKLNSGNSMQNGSSQKLNAYYWIQILLYWTIIIIIIRKHVNSIFHVVAGWEVAYLN